MEQQLDILVLVAADPKKQELFKTLLLELQQTAANRLGCKPEEVVIEYEWGDPL